MFAHATSRHVGNMLNYYYVLLDLRNHKYTKDIYKKIKVLILFLVISKVMINRHI